MVTQIRQILGKLQLLRIGHTQVIKTFFLTISSSSPTTADQSFLFVVFRVVELA